MTIIYAVIIFLLLIFIHEGGHFIAAKLCDVKVNEFSLGMGPAIIKKQKGETLYALRCIPIGGYCAMEGEDDDSEDDRALNKKSGWQKLIIFAAGALMNIVLGFVILVLIALISGTATTTIGTVDPSMPAAQAGIEAGDKVLSIDGKQAKEWTDISSTISTAERDSTLVFVIERDGEEKTIEVPVGYNEEEQRTMVGITTMPAHNPGKALSAGAQSTYSMTIGMYKVIGMLLTNKVSASELSGPVGIVQAVSQSSQMGFSYVAYLTALISLNLAVMNLLPFPALDGGRIVFLLIRKVTGKAVTDEMEGKFHLAGMLLLLALMVYVTFNDIGRLL